MYDDKYVTNIKFQINDNLDVIIVMSKDFQKQKQDKDSN